MSKYIIHACQRRLWYVKEYIIPSMLKQGILQENISIWLDDKHRGNLYACLDCFASMPNNTESTWHLQDDILICSNFKERTEELENKAMIVCGFCYPAPVETYPPGPQPANYMWYSFPCIKIQNNIARECVEWFYKEGKDAHPDEIEKCFGDDTIFKHFMKQKYGFLKVIYNAKPTLVEHVDDLIGGSIVNKDREKIRRIARGLYFEESNKVEELRKELYKRYSNGN